MMIWVAAAHFDPAAHWSLLKSWAHVDSTSKHENVKTMMLSWMYSKENSRRDLSLELELG